MTDSKDIPLEPLPDNHDRVVSIGDFFRVRHGRTPFRREKELCKHNHLVLSQSERRIWCEDCEKNIDPFDAVLTFQRQWAALDAHYKGLKQQTADGMTATLNRRASKEIDRIWSGKMLPLCPHDTYGRQP